MCLYAWLCGYAREVDVFLMKLSMIRDVLAQDDDDRKRPPVPNINAVRFTFWSLSDCCLEILLVNKMSTWIYLY